MKKKIIILSLAIFMAIGIFLPKAEGSVKPYYKGDAISYNGQLIIGTTNMTGFEVFKYEDNVLNRVFKIRSFRAKYGGFEDFNSMVFRVEGSELFAYLTDGNYLYKYNLTNLNQPTLTMQLKDNSWDWFGAVKVVNGHLVTIGTKGVKIWNDSMQVIDSYNIKTNNFYSVNFKDDGKFITLTEGKYLKIYDTTSRTFISNIEINSMDDHGRKVYSDTQNGLFYIADDSSVKAYRLDGGIVKSFKHISNLGYEVEPSTLGHYIYFTDGYGLVKLAKDDMRAIDWAYTTNLGGNEGWAMGLKVVNDDGQDKIVVFNNSSILLLNSSLELLGSAKSSEQSNGQPEEKLFLAIDKNRAGANSLVSLRGGGFGQNEDLEINFAGTKMIVKSGADGRFSTLITVPDVIRRGYDIKVNGLATKLTYSIGFDIE